MMAGRGCPYRCSYCVWSTLKRDHPEMTKLRTRSPQGVIDELVHAKRENPAMAFIDFFDDVFANDLKWLEAFAPLYRRHVNLPFFCLIHPAGFTDAKARLLKEMGALQVQMGVQSGSDRLNREVFSRTVRRETVLAAMDHLARHDLLALYDFLTNVPYETEEDRMETLTLLCRIPGRFVVQMAKVVPFPGTELARRLAADPHPPVPDEKTYRFWNALYWLAALRAASEQSLVKMTRDNFLRENPEILWEMLASLDTKPERQGEADFVRRLHADLQGEFERLRADHDRLKGRRLVRLAVALSDATKRLLGSIHTTAR